MNRPIDKNPETNQPDAAGSPENSEPVFLVVGRLRKAHGIRGEMTLEPMTDFPERIRPRKTLFMGDKKVPYQVKTCRKHDQLLIISLEGILDMDQAGAFRNELLYVRSDNLPELPDGEYYHHDLLGCRVVDEKDIPLGTLKEILQTGANDVYIVESETGEEILLPAIADVILGVDPIQKVVRVRPLEWE